MTLWSLQAPLCSSRSLTWITYQETVSPTHEYKKCESSFEQDSFVETSIQQNQCDCFPYITVLGEDGH